MCNVWGTYYIDYGHNRCNILHITPINVLTGVKCASFFINLTKCDFSQIYKL